MLRPKAGMILWTMEFYGMLTGLLHVSMKPIIHKSKIATICTLQSPNQTQTCKICYVACTHLSSWIGFSRWKVAWRHENKRTPTSTMNHAFHDTSRSIRWHRSSSWRMMNYEDPPVARRFFGGKHFFVHCDHLPPSNSRRFQPGSVVFSTAPRMCWSFLVENLPRIFCDDFWSWGTPRIARHGRSLLWCRG